MALWLIRAGQHGQFEQRFLEDNRAYLTWVELDQDLGKLTDRQQLSELLEQADPEATPGKIRNHTGQVWAFAKRISTGDWIVLPSKHKPAIHIAKVTGDYAFDASLEGPYRHSRPIEWIEQDIPRSNFDQDLLYSFGAFMTICQIKRNDAEPRIHAMAKAHWRPTDGYIAPISLDDNGDEDEVSSSITDLGAIAEDQIAKLINSKFKGHGLAELIEAILQARGYSTYRSPEGPDKGIDILAGQGPMGFGQPRICVQVKATDGPLDRPTLDQLIGAMQNVQADQGLLVSWGGFKRSVDREIANQFFRVRLWNQRDIIEQLLEHYDSLDADLRAKLPLKQVWTVANLDSDG